MSSALTASRECTSLEAPSCRCAPPAAAAAAGSQFALQGCLPTALLQQPLLLQSLQSQEACGDRRQQHVAAQHQAPQLGQAHAYHLMGEGKQRRQLEHRACCNAGGPAALRQPACTHGTLTVDDRKDSSTQQPHLDGQLLVVAPPGRLVGLRVDAQVGVEAVPATCQVGMA